MSCTHSGTVLIEREEMTGIKLKGLRVEAREFDEHLDADYVKMRMAASCEAKETMERGVEGRRNSPDFLA
jgi:hypothetical protein